MGEGKTSPFYFRLVVVKRHDQILEKQNLFAFFRPQTRRKIFQLFFTKPLDRTANLCYNSLVSKEHTTNQKENET